MVRARCYHILACIHPAWPNTSHPRELSLGQNFEQQLGRDSEAWRKYPHGEEFNRVNESYPVLRLTFCGVTGLKQGRHGPADER